MRSALICALVVITAACARPNPTQTQLAPPTPTPSPSPTPTTPLVLSATAPFHSGEVGVSYPPVVLLATGGVQPYTWSISSGALPGGLSLNADGSVSGTPNSAGAFNFAVRVGDAGGSTTVLQGAIGITPAPSASLVPACARYCSVEVGCVDVCGSFGTLNGGTPPYTFTSSGSVPPGVSVHGFTLVGTFTGVARYWQLTVTATDAYGQAASISPTFLVFPHISLASGSCTGNFNTGCSISLPYSGGAGTPSVKLVSESRNPNTGCWSPTATQPPAGYGLSVSGGSVVVTIPKGLINGYGAVWTLLLTDRSFCAASTYCTAPVATVTIGVQCG